MGDCLNANVFYNPSVSSKPLKIMGFDDPPPFTQGRLGLNRSLGFFELNDLACSVMRVAEDVDPYKAIL